MTITQAVLITVGICAVILNALVIFILNNMNAKITSICQQNSKEHDELYSGRNDHEKRLVKLETLEAIE